MIGFNYATEALYFITSCVQDRACHFGQVINGKMIFNDYGIIAKEQWEWLQKQYPYIISHAFVVMPNHIHAVLEIRRADSVTDSTSDPIKTKSLSELIGAYKTTVSKQIHLLGNLEFRWQRSFHDHIIRDAAVYDRIIRYIETNPERWETDTFFQ